MGPALRRALCDPCCRRENRPCAPLSTGTFGGLDCRVRPAVNSGAAGGLVQGLARRCFRGPVGQTRRGVATAAGTLGGLENAVLARSTFSTLSATPRFARQGAGAAHGPVGLCGGWCPWGECVRGGILSFPCGYYRSAAQSFILLEFPAHFALPLPRLFHVLHRPCHHLRLRPRRQEPLDPLPLPPASPPRAAPCSTTRIH